MIVVGGRQRRDARTVPSWERCEEALVAQVDPEAGDAGIVLRYDSTGAGAAAAPVPSPFKAGSLQNGRLYLCTTTELLVVRRDDLVTEARVSLPCFNDVHHVLPSSADRLLVANTGLDAVLRVTGCGELEAIWNVLGEDPWARFDPEVDYRRVASTKPHRSHPNHLFMLDNELWVTRFEQRDAVRVRDPGRDRIAIDIERPHDGVVTGSGIYFTTVDGHVVVACPERKRVTAVHDLNELEPRSGPLGWCRGLAVLTPEVVVVGFSRIRGTRFRRNLEWLGRRVGPIVSAPRPARVTAYDLAARRVAWSVDLESIGMDVVFSVLPDRGMT